ncbi:hypothetical protein Gorai_019274 [Gossypium raimondii]|uniref:RNase H type-1 domain-containing protein n=1 Tax=Gossypium raimondii TaxID=29730 RepID=A0A7J8PMS4_GOSRA|nr:hypothetical protein [Gossypium raimondii]
MDGAFLATSPTSIRGVFRDSDANWLCEFLMAFGKDFIFKVEARAILKGLIMAWEKGFRHIEVECDNALLVGEIIVYEDPSDTTKGLLVVDLVRSMPS